MKKSSETINILELPIFFSKFLSGFPGAAGLPGLPAPGSLPGMPGLPNPATMSQVPAAPKVKSEARRRSRSPSRRDDRRDRYDDRDHRDRYDDRERKRRYDDRDYDRYRR